MKGLLFTYGLTGGGAIAALMDPFVGLLVYVCFAIVRPESMWPWAVAPGSYSRIVAVCLLAGWMLQGCGNWRFGRATGIVVALVCLWLWTLALVRAGSDPSRAWDAFEAFSKIVLPFLVGITTIDSLRKVKQLAWVIVLCEGYVAFELNLSYFAGYNRIWEEGFGGMDNNCNAIAMVSCVGLATFLGMHAEGWWRKGLALSAWLWMVHAILLSMSRGGMLALCVTMLVSFLLIPKRLPHYLALVVGVALVLRLAGPMVTDRFGTTFASAETRDESAESRLQLWSACWKSMLAHPFGIGPAHWPVVSDQYGFASGKEAHSLWMQTGAELGFPGLGLLALFYGICLVRLWPLTSERAPLPDPWYRNFARMVVAALVGFAVSATFVSVQGVEHPYYIVLIGASVLKLLSEEQASYTRSNFTPSYIRPDRSGASFHASRSFSGRHQGSVGDWR